MASSADNASQTYASREAALYEASICKINDRVSDIFKGLA